MKKINLFSKKDKPLYSSLHKNYLKKLKKQTFWVIFFRIMLLICFIATWELLSYYRIIDPFFFSSPSRIFNTSVELFKSGEIYKHIGVTLYETLLGFFISSILGTIIAILLWPIDFVRRIIEPYLVVLNALPKIALGPIIVIWFGTGTSSILVMCILICLIITTITMLNSFLSCDNDKILLLKSMGANKFQILFKLILPNSIGEFVSILKINVGLSWVGTIMGEYLASRSGLGYLIVYGGQVFKLDLVFASTIILCFLAGVMYFGVSLLEKKFNKKQNN